jgi:hypothetical protein
MSILWPRFIVLASLSLMFILYYFLAMDEQRRMLKAYPESYSRYMSGTGMFLPRGMEKHFAFMPKGASKYILAPAMIVTLVIGSGFILRAVTLNSLYFESKGSITLLSVLPEDNKLDAVALEGIMKARSAGELNMLKEGRGYLGYLMPGDYIMQGMIANTGDDFHLFKKHNTVMMISEWVLHPFQHLRSSPSLHMAKMHNVDPAVARRHHCPLGINDASLSCDTCPYRRIIIDEVSNDRGTRLEGRKLLSFDSRRAPVAFIDINTKTGKIVNAKEVEKATAWADVPTPAI